MPRIDDWLARFRDAWRSRDIDAVMDLFTTDVDYRETPFQELSGRDAVRAAWEPVRDQEDISLDLDVYARDDPRYAVRWNLAYTRDGQRHRWKGVYLIELDDDGRCVAFTQVGEQAPSGGG